ncbi:MAG: GDSL-type esterase/lipase family protein [Deltaproteobacteria bacterium]|jgi:lysophospholipase L1-like esterase|nr:GDSL-type esterase/lipase family protein [Deltaproteobacteria bacterium]
MAWALSLGILALLAAPAWAAEGGPEAPLERVVFLGDSLTYWGGAFMGERAGVEVFNLGKPGDSTARIWSRLDQAVELRPTRIFLQGGINDLGRGDSAADVRDVHEKIWAEIKERLPGARLYVCSLIPIRESFFSNKSPRFTNAYIKAVNGLLAKSAQEAKVAYVDLFTPLLGPDGQLPSQLTYDGVHLRPMAYKIWAETLRPYLP